MHAETHAGDARRRGETHMKKISTILLCLFIVAGLCACGRSAKPDLVVKTFSEAMKKTDLEGMANTVKGNAYDTSVLDLTDEISVQLFEYMRSENTKMTYTIDQTAVDGDRGTVDVTYRYSDASPIVEATMGEYLSRAMSLAFGGASEDEIGELFMKLFMENAKTVSPVQAESTVTFSCAKAGSTWEIEEVPDEITNILTCNMVNSMDSLGGAGR